MSNQPHKNPFEYVMIEFSLKKQEELVQGERRYSRMWEHSPCNSQLGSVRLGRGFCTRLMFLNYSMRVE